LTIAGKGKVGSKEANETIWLKVVSPKSKDA
jgi:hypothetical protein